MTDSQPYQLRDGIDRVVRSGLTLAAGETIEAPPTIEDDHGDVLEPIDDGDEDGGAE